MSRIEFDNETREALARLIAGHLQREFEVEVAPFDAQDLLDFLSETLGPHYYNRGLADAQAILQSRVDGVMEAIQDIEKPVGLR